MNRVVRNILVPVFLMFCLPRLCASSCITAEITAWNKAVLSGDVGDMTSVSFLNSAHRKGTVGKGDTAVLVISGLPECKLQRLTAWVKSNKSSGAGSLTVAVDGEACFSVSGSFDKWSDNGYQTSFVPLSKDVDWQVEDGGEASLTIIGTVNSIYLEKFQIEYEAAAASAHCVTYVWHTAQETATATVCEDEAGKGVMLADLSEQGLSRVGDWQLAGWSTTSLDGEGTLEKAPAFAPVNTEYHFSHDRTLYPVYHYAKDIQSVTQTSQRQSGEYVVVRNWLDGFVMMSGFVSGGTVSAVPCSVARAEDGTCRFLPDHVPAESRYLLEFEEDSVTVFHPFSETCIGYSGTRLANNCKKWAFREYDNHSVCLYYDLQGDTLARTLAVRGDLRDENNSFVDAFSSVRFDLRKIHEMLLLFEVSALPLEPAPSLWCGNPFVQTGIESPENQGSYESAVKCVVNGCLLIRRAGRYYDTLGRELLTGAGR